MTQAMTPTDALEMWRNFVSGRLPSERVCEHNQAYEVLRKLVVDDIARKKNSAETEKMIRKDP